jgi:hypothetical protein
LLFWITASSVASEETFSNAGDIIDERRYRLLSENAQELVSISQNKKLEIDIWKSKFYVFNLYFLALINENRKKRENILFLIIKMLTIFENRRKVV